MKSIKERRFLEIEEGLYCLWRLGDDEYRRLREKSCPININSLLILNICLDERNDPDRLSLAKALITLEDLFDKSSELFDSWKCSFVFPLLLRISKQTGKFLYLLRIGDYRGILDIGLYRLSNSATEIRNEVFHDPIDDEFSNEEINRFICYFYGFLRGMSRHLKPQHPFLNRVQSQLMFYGYDGYNFFEEEFDSEAEYNTAIVRIEQKYVALQKNQQNESLRSLVEEITGEPYEDF
ncbi:MAG: hypothetical protein WCD18_17245 [Thermosynechococcaceae cyanobacterium]